MPQGLSDPRDELIGYGTEETEFGTQEPDSPPSTQYATTCEEPETPLANRYTYPGEPGDGEGWEEIAAHKTEDDWQKDDSGT